MAAYQCDVCKEAIQGNDYKLAGIDREAWRSLIVHIGCWPRRHELDRPGVTVVVGLDEQPQKEEA